MDYQCGCENNYLFVNPLCQLETLDQLEVILEAIINGENDNAEESLATIQALLSSMTSTIPGDFISSLPMEIPSDAEEMPYWIENPFLKDAFKDHQLTEQISGCEKCTIINPKISGALNYGFFLLCTRQYKETELIRKIIYLLAPFRKRHKEIPQFYSTIWKFAFERKLSSSLYEDLMLFHSHPVEEMLDNLIASLEFDEYAFVTLHLDLKYQELADYSKKSKRIFNFILDSVVQRFLVSRKVFFRDFLTHFIEYLKNLVLPTNFINMFRDILYPFAAFFVYNYNNNKRLVRYIEEMRISDYKMYVALGLSFKRYHFLTDELIK
ncbi:uncharacterized protein LOC132257895 [Phlebotomus argentipes]|uniref:uncharacterized protein LOC132257895 n=1 Tax=Phlebotomus argentipes TaxID=94469 RepID=UPI002892DDE9|nr:uncharacterized protein LOC132257895 [Phlebotomus argentipes]